MSEDAFKSLMSRETIYVATGDTFPHRDLFVSWAWHWDAGRKAWIEDNASDDDWPGITCIKELPGVIVTEEVQP